MEPAKVVGFLPAKIVVQKRKYVPKPMTFQPFKEALKSLEKHE